MRIPQMAAVTDRESGVKFMRFGDVCGGFQPALFLVKLKYLPCPIGPQRFQGHSVSSRQALARGRSQLEHWRHARFKHAELQSAVAQVQCEGFAVGVKVFRGRAERAEQSALGITRQHTRFVA